MKKNRFTILNITKVMVQVLAFIFLPALFVSTFAGIKGLYLSVINNEYNVSVLIPQLIEAFAIVPLTLLFGRFFCGWMCAFGTLGDLIYSLSKKIFKTNLKVGKKLDGILKYAKFLVLVFLMVFVWGMGYKVFKSSNPWDVFGMLATIGKKPDISYVLSDLAPGLVILLLIIGMSFIIERFFCRYLCPLGAVFAIISKLRITKIGKPAKACGKCRICTDNCPMGISMYEKDIIGSGECINCFKCTLVCPRGNVSLKVVNADVKPLVAGTMAVALMTGIYYAGDSINSTDTTVQKSTLS
ncbi:MAG TPA: 4Fe-4S binding protein, partial [Clostridia bacterium]|nr:4Fe-4S binding protein [Clostridia bacterium]